MIVPQYRFLSDKVPIGAFSKYCENIRKIQLTPLFSTESCEKTSQSAKINASAKMTMTGVASRGPHIFPHKKQLENSIENTKPGWMTEINIMIDDEKDAA